MIRKIGKVFDIVNMINKLSNKKDKTSVSET